MDTRKVRPDAILRQLPEERQMAIYEELEKKPAAKVRAALKSDGLEVGSTALYEFYQFWSVELRFRKAEVSRQQVIARALAETPEISLQQVEDFADAVFLQTAAADGDLSGYVKLRRITEGAKRTALEGRRLSLLEKKAAQLDALEASLKEKKGKGGLSAETLELIESSLGMMK